MYRPYLHNKSNLGANGRNRGQRVHKLHRLQKAFNSVDGKIMWSILKQFDRLDQCINITRLFYDNSTARTEYDGDSYQQST